ncbi:MULTISPECIES: hypothetical protein [Streptomyces]|uniref:hypothetical protein n=1 Tax=Streptomyces TaxID=1883 RepID=UPI0021AF9C7C|nr:hypothetical protein [Streptomyces sp. WAC00469]
MKISTPAGALVVLLALATMTGCSLNRGDADANPVAGTSTSRKAADAVEEVSSGVQDMIDVKGKASDDQPFVMECVGRPDSTYFRIYHWWNFYPASAEDLDVAMERLKAELPKHGWKTVHYGPDSSKQKNIRLAADNDHQKVGIDIVKRPKNDPPKLSMYVVSGCYAVPDGQEVEKF